MRSLILEEEKNQKTEIKKKELRIDNFKAKSSKNFRF